MAHERVIRIRDLAKRYGSETVLDVTSLDIDAGESYAIIGPNGAGKTTLLRILAGTLQASAGTIDIPDGWSVGYVPQHPFVFNMSVLANVAMAVRDRGLARAERNNRVMEALEIVDMQDFADARGPELSGGQAQRVALARVFAQRHDLILLDEPTSAMDIKGTTAVEQALAKYCQQHGTTLVSSTHAPSQAQRISSRIIVLDEGKVVESGDTSSVLHDPASSAAREFLSYWRL